MRFVRILLMLTALSFISSASGYAHSSWDLYDRLVHNHYKNGAIVEYDENGSSHISAEGMSYGMFFTLVMKDRERFDALFHTLRQSLCKSEDFTTAISERRLETQNEPKAASTATELFVAYDLIIASELFADKKYLKYADNILKRVDRDNTATSLVLGRVLLPAATGFERSDEFTIAPASLPPFVMQKIASYYPGYKDLYRNTVQSVVRGSGDGYVADYLSFTYISNLIVRSTTVGTKKGALYYLWLGITSTADPNRRLMLPLYENMTVKTDTERFSPSLANLYLHTTEGVGSLALDACMLPLTKERTHDYLRTRLKAHVFDRTEFTSLALAMFATGSDERHFELKKDGSLYSEY